MKNVIIAFEEFEGDAAALQPKHNGVKFLIILDIKMVQNFRRKERIVVGGILLMFLMSYLTIMPYLEIIYRFILL